MVAVPYESGPPLTPRNGNNIIAADPVEIKLSERDEFERQKESIQMIHLESTSDPKSRLLPSSVTVPGSLPTSVRSNIDSDHARHRP